MDWLRSLKLLFIWNHAKGCREAMKLSYKKHFGLFLDGKAPETVNSAHGAGLYGALGTRYKASGIPFWEGDIWPQLVPFQIMNEKIGMEALAEYAVYQEKPEDAELKWLKEMVNKAFSSDEFKSSKTHRITAMMGLQRNAPWCELLDPDVREFLEKDAAYITSEIEKGTWDID